MRENGLTSASAAALPLRIVIGVAFFAHGAQKLLGIWGGGGISGTAVFFAKTGIPLASFFAVVVSLVEFFGGIVIFLGLYTRWAAIPLSIDMIVALFSVHIKKGFFVNKGGFELVFLLLGCAIALVILGSGVLSLDRFMSRRSQGKRG